MWHESGCVYVHVYMQHAERREFIIVAETLRFKISLIRCILPDVCVLLNQLEKLCMSMSLSLKRGVHLHPPWVQAWLCSFSIIITHSVTANNILLRSWQHIPDISH